MSRIHVRPLRAGVPADNGSRVMLAESGAIREGGPFWDRMRQIGAVAIRELPARGQVVMIRPVEGSRVLASGHRAAKTPEDKEPGEGVLSRKGAEIAWTEAHEGALADQLIEFPEPSSADLKQAEVAAQQERDLAETEYDLSQDGEVSHA